MAEIKGSESSYKSSRQGAPSSGAAQGAAPAPLFGSSVVTPPISGPMQNIAPGSQEWINARMAAIIEQLRRQYSDAASRRGVLQSGAAEKDFSKAVANAERQVALEAADYNAQVASREDAQAHERQVARESGRAQERAAMMSGLGQMAPYALFGDWGGKSGTMRPMMKQNPDGSYSEAVDEKGATKYQQGPGGQNLFGKMAGGVKGALSTPSSPDYDTFGRPSDGGTWGRLTAGGMGTGLGTMLSSGKNKTASLLSGIGASGLGAASGMSGAATGGLSALASGMISNKSLHKPLKGDNLWKNLVGGLALYGAGGGFGRF